VPTLPSGLSYIDLLFLGRPHAIATAVVQSAGSIALVDPGPTSCLPVLERELVRQGIRLADVTHILLTHIHLDHAGATGTLLERHPHVRVLVHERGAPHLVDPSRLLDSRERGGAPTTAPQRVDITDVAVLNVTVTGSTAAGYVAVEPCASTNISSLINTVPSEATANVTAVGADATGSVCAAASVASHLIVDQVATFAS
jgi:L-ascorbate metabolism protein UlaG (beta-lactamase superfamily)